MHPHLVQGKQIKCGELIAALDECHNRGLMARMTGACNDIKHELNMCLREERLERTAKHIQESRSKAAEKKKMWAAIDAES